MGQQLYSIAGSFLFIRVRALETVKSFRYRGFFLGTSSGQEYLCVHKPHTTLGPYNIVAKYMIYTVYDVGDV
jgi:hypothetical protein